MNLAAMSKNTKVALLAGAALILLLFFVLVVMRPGDVEVELVTVPEDATITVDGQPAKAGKFLLKAGEHTLKATREHFADYEKKVNTKDLTRGQQVYLTPAPNSPEALTWLRENPGDPQKRQAAGDAAATAAQEELSTNYPVLEDLPHESINYKIDYSLSTDRKKLSFHITLMPDARPGDEAGRRQQLHDFKAEALKFLTDRNIDLSKHDITYDPAEAKDL